MRRLTANQIIAGPKAKTPLHVNAAADLWLELFTSAIEETVYWFTYNEKPIDASVAINNARDIANHALSEYENRWPGIIPPRA